MERMHSLLKRQIKRHLEKSDDIPKQWEALINAVNEAYWQMDLDREMLERSLDLSSQELLQANSEMRAVLKAFPDLLFRTDHEGIILDYQTSDRTDLHFLRGKVIGKQIHDMFPKDLGEKFRDAFDQLQITNSPVSIEYPLTGQDGESFYEARLLPLLENQIIIIVRNITQRKRMEERLRESEQRLSDIIDFLPDATFAIDLNGKVMAWNQAIEEMTGIKSEEMVGKGDYEHALPFYGVRRPILIDLVFIPDDVIKEKYHFVKKEGDVLLAEAFVPFPFKGESRELWGKARPLYDSKGNVVGAIESIRDITDRKEMEAELLKAQKLESVGILAGGIAHDFNNLFAAIMGYIDLAKSYSHPGNNIYNNLERAERSCLQASELTKRLITFSKGGEPLRKVTSLFELIEDACTQALRGSNIRCNMSLPDDLWPILVDEGQIKQVAYGLIMNAKEAMPDGGMITIRAENRKVTEYDGLSLEGGMYVQWSVTDHGIGIPRENLARIFDPYFSTKERESTKGMGLGLSICYSIIKRHNGLIMVASEPGTGTTFNIYLPAAESREALQKVRKNKTAGKDAVESVSITREKILVMDDDEFIRDMMGSVLSQLGYDVEVVRDEDEAIALYEKAETSDRPFTLIILDLTIHGGRGGEFVIQKLLQINPRIRAIVSSGYINDHILTNYRQYGFKGAIAKPFTIARLKEVLSEVLSIYSLGN